jgi:glycosyltransferase involved in cell wall biosynthesis
MEWIIVDDGTDNIKDLVDESGISQIKYYRIDQKMKLGAKRNYMHLQTTGSIIVYMDDDDYYPPERVQHAVDTLILNKDAMCAGSSEIYIYYKHIQKMYQCGPYNKNHATAGTFAFKRELLQESKYDDDASLSEERFFLKNYTIPMIQLDPLKTILVFAHIHNSFDKRHLLEQDSNPQFFKESPRLITDFIRQPNETDIHDFFVTKIDDLLIDYKPGEPEMKPDVVEQFKKMNEARNQIMINLPGKEPRAMTNAEVVKCLSDQKTHIDILNKLVKELREQLKNKE